MRKKNEYDENMPIGKLTRVKDFLPPPEELIFPEESAKITISLSRKSIEFFKRAARQHHQKYQCMIRQVLDLYAGLYSKTS
ncbi:MAG: CopG family transcriptional regulator [Candidatus Omnitrophota bacterium]